MNLSTLKKEIEDGLYPDDQDNYYITPLKLEEIINQVVEAVEESVVEEMRSPYRPNDREFYNDQHRECGYLVAKQHAEEAFTKFRGV